MRLLSLFLASSFLVAGFSQAANAKDQLTIYTYDSFTADWGPGPQVKKNFEEICDCELNWVAAADGAGLLNRLKLEGKNTQADIVLGLDNNLLAEARDSKLFVKSNADLSNIKLPEGFSDEYFVPYDYSYFAVIYDSEKMKNPPRSLQELVDDTDGEKIVLQDPRTSTPGLGMLLWMKAVYGENAEKAWEKLNKRVLTVTPGWSESYGLFTKGEVPMVLSYTTSPAYHIIAEGSERYKAIPFDEGHYLQVEVAGVTTKGSENPLSAKFMDFMTGPGFQDVIPETNWMLPAGKTSKPLNAGFDKLITPEKALILPSEEIARNRKLWTDEWLSAASQ